MSETPKQFWKKIRSQADRTLGDHFWSDLSGLLPNAQPRADVYQTEHTFVVIIEVPGVNVEQSIKLSVFKNVLHIKGDIAFPYPVEEEAMLVSERFFGQFHRKVSLPTDVSSVGMKAQYRDGLLMVQFQRKQEPDTVIDIAIEPSTRKRESTSEPTDSTE
ncbi:MAG: molecular chaperone [Paenibacillus sp.]|nr:molecular chaperone [Paenibacillus sp.]